MRLIESILSGFWLAFKHIWWLMPFFMWLVWRQLPRTKGRAGEKMVQIRASLKLDSKIYRPFHNLILPDGQGTTEIDHVYVSPYGIFVVETKNYQGWIFGSANNHSWTQVIYRNKNQFPNPIKQNIKHIKALSAILKQPENVFHSVVVFTHHNYQFKTTMPHNVCDLTQFDAYIRHFQTQILSEQEVQAACAVLQQPQFMATRERMKQHINHLKRR